MRYQGRITTWKDDKGFGFITPNGEGEKVFVHINAFSSRPRRPAENALVTYELALDDQGRPQARGVAFVGMPAVPGAAPGRSRLPVIFAFGFVAFVAGSVALHRLPLAVLALYAAASVVAFVAYWFDKSAAQRDQWRTPENTLHMLALVGGWPGALAAQRLLRHKSAKASFQAMYWATVALNCGALAWFLSPYGARVFG